MKNPQTLFPSQLTIETLALRSVKNQLPEAMGIVFDRVGPDYLQASLRVDARHLRTGGLVNGGVFLMLIETVGSVSCECLIDRERQLSLGIQVSANHIRTARVGDTLIARSKLVHLGKTTHIWDVIIENQSEQLISSGRITLLIVSKK